jgi:hypothetical protein
MNGWLHPNERNFFHVIHHIGATAPNLLYNRIFLKRHEPLDKSRGRELSGKFLQFFLGEYDIPTRLGLSGGRTHQSNKTINKIFDFILSNYFI